VKLNSILKPEHIKIDCTANSREELLTEIVSSLKGMGLVTDAQQIIDKLIERERMGSTSIGNNAAVPHTKIRGLQSPLIFIAVSRKGIIYHEQDKAPVHLAILILSPNESPIIHLQILAAAASLIKKSKNLIRDILNVKSPDEVLEIIRRNESQDD